MNKIVYSFLASISLVTGIFAMQVPEQQGTLLHTIINTSNYNADVEIMRGSDRVRAPILVNAGKPVTVDFPLLMGDIVKVSHEKISAQKPYIYKPSGRTPKVNIIIGDTVAATKVVASGSLIEPTPSAKTQEKIIIKSFHNESGDLASVTLEQEEQPVERRTMIRLNAEVSKEEIKINSWPLRANDYKTTWYKPSKNASSVSIRVDEKGDVFISEFDKSGRPLEQDKKI